MAHLHQSLHQSVHQHWHDEMVGQPGPDDGAYMTGWTISGVAVLGTIVAVWLLGI